MKKRMRRQTTGAVRLHFAVVVLAALVAVMMSGARVYAAGPAGSTAPLPVVAIHASELTQALEGFPAMAPTPTGPDTSGKEWWYTSWHYATMFESLKEALRSDGTPFVEVSDAQIASGALRNADGSPKYPILVSLASE